MQTGCTGVLHMPKKKSEYKEVYTFRIDPRLMEKIKQYAVLNETNASNVIRDALLCYKPIKKYFTT